jgi:hypothetical protein
MAVAGICSHRLTGWRVWAGLPSADECDGFAGEGCGDGVGAVYGDGAYDECDDYSGAGFNYTNEFAYDYKLKPGRGVSCERLADDAWSDL